MVDLRAVDLGAGQIARAGKDGRAHVEEIEARQFADEVEVRLEKCADGADVLPVALKDEGKNAAGLDGLGDNVLAEVGQRVIEQIVDDGAVENVDAHRGQKKFARPLMPAARIISGET